MKQASLFENVSKSEKRYFSSRKSHGGVSKGRKLKRPLVSGKWTHLILKSEKAKGELSFLKPHNGKTVRQILRDKSKKFGIEISQYQNMGNHLHLLIRFSNRENFQKFLKAVTNLIARKITGARKGIKYGKFWQGLAFTRIVTSAIELLQLKGYFEANKIQREQGYEARKDHLEIINSWIKSLKDPLGSSHSMDGQIPVLPYS